MSSTNAHDEKEGRRSNYQGVTAKSKEEQAEEERNRASLFSSDGFDRDTSRDAKPTSASAGNQGSSRPPADVSGHSNGHKQTQGGSAAASGHEEDPVDANYHFDFSDLDITTEDVDFSEIDQDLEKFQKVDIVKEALEKGVDLRQYARQIDGELEDVEVDTISDYIDNADGVAGLYQELNQCESILQHMQDMLGKFQSNLGGISDEIKTLQNESLNMNVKLKNRREVADRLRAFLDKVAVSEELIHSICDEQIDTNWVENLKALSKKIRYNRRPHGDRPTHHQYPESSPEGSTNEEGDDGEEEANPYAELGVDPADTLAGQDALPTLEKLRVKAVTRIREYLLHKIAELRKPKTNIQKQQEYVLLKMRYLYEFLEHHAPDIALEIRVAYVECMGRTLHATFRSYQNALHKLQIPVATKYDLIAVEQTVARGLFGGRVESSKRTDAFVVGERKSVLDDAGAPPVAAHIAQSQKTRFPFEVLFRNVQRHLMDAASAEFSFDMSFFGSRHGNDIFTQVFSKTISHILENLEDFLFNSYDGVGLLILIHMTQQHRSTMEERGVKCLDNYFDRVNMLLWPRFKFVFDANLNSVRNADPSKLGRIDLAPHYVTQRYAEFCASILWLHRSLQKIGLSDDMMMHNLTILRREMEQLWNRMGHKFESSEKKLAFTINNLQHCVTVAKERNVPQQDVTAFQELLDVRIQHFVEEELRKHFGKMIDFVSRVERHMREKASETETSDSAGGEAGAESSGQFHAESTAGVAAQSIPDVNPDITRDEAKDVANDFISNWKQRISHLDHNVKAFYGSSSNGSDIFKKTLAQFLLYYTRFQAILKKAFPENPDFRRNLVTVSTIYTEIGKHRGN